MKRLEIIAAGAALAVLMGIAAPAQAHHGWGWYGNEGFELTGTVEDANMGGPHGHLKLRVDGELWDVILGWKLPHAAIDGRMMQGGSK
jgi:hypothetical protein